MKKKKITHVAKKYDVRVLHFEKRANRTSAIDSATDSNWDYICLGHFDRVTAESLSNCRNANLSPLQIIGNNIKDGSLIDDNYVFSLYLLRESKANNACTNFWDSKKNFCSIIRLHCDLAKIGEIKEPLISYLENYFHNLTNPFVKYIQPGKVHVYNFDVSYMVYNSLELGDAVVILKSDSIVAMLEISRCLNFNSIVCDTYTYCLIQTQLLKQDVTEETSGVDVTEKSQQDNTRETALPQTEAQPPTLGYAATRFAVRDAYAADLFLQKLCIKSDENNSYPKAHFITGTTDLIIEWGPCSENEFVQYMRQIAQRGILPHTKKTVDDITVQAAFNDVVTRVGLDYRSKPAYTTGTSEQGLCPTNKKPVAPPILPSEINFCRGKIGLFSDRSFKHSFIRIMGTLESMLHNSITDDLYNLLYPSTRAIISRITYIEKFNRQHEQDFHFQEDVIRYLEKWELLAGDITNLESQLVHHPELQVVRYYAPAMVLQFELEFAIVCSKLLSGSNARCFIPMLALSQETAVSTECLLDPFDDPYDGECALITQIPSEMLYNPWKVAYQLCHEMSHYSGDVARNRKIRKDILCECMAEWIARYWAEPYIDNIPSIRHEALQEFRKFCDDFKRKLYKLLQQSLKDYADNLHLESLCEKIQQHCSNICNNQQLREQFQNVALSYLSEDEQLAFLGKTACAVNATAYPTMMELNDLKKHLAYLKSCLKEGYADISMIMLLDCSDRTYIECVFADEIERVQNKYSGINHEELYNTLNPHIDRYALVHAAIKAEQLSEKPICIRKKLLKRLHVQAENQSKDEWLKKAKEKAYNAIASIQGDADIYWELDVANLLTEHLRMSEATAIINYFVICIKDLQCFINDKNNIGKVEQLRRALRAVRPDCFDWSELQKFLFEARKRRNKEYQKEGDQENYTPQTPNRTT